MKRKQYKGKYERKLNKINKIKKRSDYRWIIKIVILAFFITLIFSSLAELILPKFNIILGAIIIAFFIILGVIFDMIGIAVASASESPFHSMASKKIYGAKTGILMLKETEKVTSFCNDVIGDICNIMSGGAGIVMANKIALNYQLNLIGITLLITSLIASFTIGGKAMGKSLAVNKSELIVFKVAKMITIFYKK